MTLEEILSLTDAGDVIAALKAGRLAPQPDVERAKKALSPALHDVNSLSLRPDKKVRTGEVNNPDGYRIEKVNRISLALQKLIIKRAVAFLFGNPVSYDSAPQTGKEKLVAKALDRILHDVKEHSLNRKVARKVFAFKEAAELWFPVAKEHENYGFASKFKLRATIFSPDQGDTLYPFFDESGDMVAFSRSFTKKDDKGKDVEYFETYTDNFHYLWSFVGGVFGLLDGYPTVNPIGKIPVVYARQEAVETQDVDSLISRLETLLSNFADTNDYHASPKIFIKGDLKGFSKKGEPGGIIEGEPDSDAKYLSWQNAPESVRTEIETLLRMIYTITQTPDISFEAVKGLGAISGIALKLLFMDAHLKVQDKLEIFDEYLQRRVNIIKAFIGVFNLSLSEEVESLIVEPEVTPYMLTNEMDDVNLWLAASGNKPLVSQKQAAKSAGLSTDPEADYDQMQEEATAAGMVSSFEPTI